MDEISVSEAAALLEAADPPLLLDVREQSEWDLGRLPGALHIPLSEVRERAEEVAPDRSRAIITYCAVGQRSLLAAQDLAELGYGEVSSMAGGIVDWQGQGLPVE